MAHCILLPLLRHQQINKNKWGNWLLVVNFNQLPSLHSFRDIKLQASKILGSRPWPFGVTWRHWSCDHWTHKVQFPIGSQYEPTMYLARLMRHQASKILGSQPWPFRVTWRHKSRDHWTPNMQFPIDGPLKPSHYLTSLLRYYVRHFAKHILIKNPLVPIFVFGPNWGLQHFATFCL